MLNFFAEAFDLPILEWMQANLQSDFMDFIMPIITMFGEGGIFWIACAAAMLIFPKTRKTGLTMGLALLMGVVVCNLIMKPLFARMRPYVYETEILGKAWTDFLEGGKLLVSFPSDKSFPSGHTIASFEASIPLLMYNKKLGIPAVILACLVTFSRLYLFVHYPTDVIASIILGTAFAILASFLVKKYWSRLPARLRGEPA